MIMVKDPHNDDCSGEERFLSHKYNNNNNDNNNNNSNNNNVDRITFHEINKNNFHRIERENVPTSNHVVNIVDFSLRCTLNAI